MEHITSRSNDFIIFTGSLRDAKKRKESGMFTFEGKKLFSEAVKRCVPLEAVLFTEENEDAVSSLSDSIRKILVSQSVYEKISCEKSPSGIFCLAKGIDKFHKFATIYYNKIKGSKIILESIRDPGNLGTIIRTASALGVGEVILSNDCADIYGEKTVRAAMGTLFSQHVTVCNDLVPAVKVLQSEGFKVYSAALKENAVSLTDIPISEKTVFIIGNEGHGISDELINASDAPAIIPMPGEAESFNASIAAAIVMWECAKAQMKQ